MEGSLHCNVEVIVDMLNPSLEWFVFNYQKSHMVSSFLFRGVSLSSLQEEYVKSL